MAGLVAGLVFALAGSALAQPQAVAARIGAYPDKTRFVLELTAPADFRVFVLPRPYRVVIDFPEIAERLPAAAGETGNGLITGYRYGLFKPGTWRVVLDMTGPVKVAQSFVLPPEDGGHLRYVFDLVPVSRAAFDRALTESLATRAPAAPAPAATRRPPGARPVVVIDPGHGGVDPGAIGHRGTFEKRVTLEVAKEVKRVLEATGRYKVVLTRVRDVFVGLRERIARARAAGASLFISLHADSLRNARVRGASVYTLSEKASDQEAGMLAARENKADILGGMDLSENSQDVTSILIDLAQRESMNEGARFAAMLIGELRKTTSLLQRTHRFAGFAVLKAPDVPSVLFEMGYLSNTKEERNLTSKSHRRKLALAIRRAADQFFARQQALSQP